MRRTPRVLTAMTALVLPLAGCGDGSVSPADDTAGGATPDSPVSGELTFWDTSDPANEGPAFEQLVERFEAANPEVDVTYQSVPFGDAQNKFKTAAESGSGAPDVMRAEVAWVSEFASLGYLQAIDGTSLLADEDDYLEAPLSSNVFDGRTYGVPQVTDSLALMYNEELFEQAGIEQPPTTWAEVESAAEALRSEAGVEGIFVSPGGYFLLPFIYGEGGDLVDVDSKRILVNAPEAVAGVTRAQELIETGAAVDAPAGDAYSTMMTMFTEGKVGMIINGPWEVKNISQAPEFGGLENLGIAPVPAGSVQAGAPVGGHNYVVWSGMVQEKAEAAIAFITFMNSTESQAFLAAELGLLPTRKSAYETEEVAGSPIVSAFGPVLEAAHPRPWIPEGGQFFTALDEMAVETLVKGTGAQEALDQVARTYKSEVVTDYATVN